MSTTKTRTSRCAAGHDWQAPVQRGRPPRYCPEHAPENSTCRPRGYAAWEPQPETRELLEEVKNVLIEYAGQLPLTVRQIFYRLVGAYGYEKTELAYGRLCEKMVRARRARLIDFDDIRDDGIDHWESPFYDDIEDFWDAMGTNARKYRRDRQAGQGKYVELWCEAAGMAPQLHRIAKEFAVPVFSAGGFLSLSAVREIVDRAANRDMATVIMHVGDFDPSGESIFDALLEDAQAFLEEDRSIALQQIHGDRIALTAAQVEEYDLPTAPPKKTDSRAARWKGGGTCQVEALRPDTLAEIVKEEIEAWFDGDLLDGEIAQEEKDRVQILRALPSGN